MLYPNCETIEKLSGEYNTIPVCKELYADTATPILLLRKLAARSSRCFLLESVEGGENWARYSFLGFDPILRAACKDGVVSLEGEREASIREEKPLTALRRLMSRYRAPKLPGMPPFTGGLVGYFSYSMLGYAEPTLHLNGGEENDFDLMLFDRIIAYDHFRQKILIIVNMQTDHVLENYGKAAAEMERIGHILSGEAPPLRQKDGGRAEFRCNVDKETYCGMVENTKEYIRNGDIFQAVISRRFESKYDGSLINPYRVLRTTNPSPYMVYLRLDDMEMMCSSPETLVRLKDGRLSTFPVAGSRPRGKTEEEDLRLERELLSDEKELSEHNMLVDLARNDLGRISKMCSVKMMDYMMVHRYSQIMHLASRVESDIAPDRDALDAIEAVLPAGTLSGAPKIRACQIIGEQERGSRGIYGGALGYIDFSGNMDTCIAIRMAVKKNGTGGGIVADSVPELEYEESGNKAKAVIDAIIRAGEGEER